MKRLRFVRMNDWQIEIKAPLKATGKLSTLGYCHPATVPLIRKDGVRRHLHLITLK